MPEYGSSPPDFRTRLFRLTPTTSVPSKKGPDLSQTIWVAKCLCPNGHTVASHAVLLQSHVAQYDLKMLKHWTAKCVSCPTCGASPDTWTYECDPTDFATLDDAATAARQGRNAQDAHSARVG